jgi:transposase
MSLFCGIDWATDHHDIAIVDHDGRVVASGRVENTASGFTQLLAMLADAGEDPQEPMPVAIETDHGLWVAALTASGRQVYPINPLAASRYRSRHAVSGAKSDAVDARTLANILRTDLPEHHPRSDDSELAQSVRVLARAQQDTIWNRQQVTNRIIALLKEFYPAALEAFAGLEGGITRPDARMILTAVPTPAQEADLTPARLRKLMTKAGRQRYLDRDAVRLREVFTAEQLRQPAMIEEAMGRQLSALLGQLNAIAAAVTDLTEAVTETFHRHPDAKILTSFPGVGPVVGARVLAEIGDDRTKFDDARGLKAFAGSAPITRASGKKTVVLHRHIKNRRLTAVDPIWALSSLRASPGARRHFDARRTAGDWNHQAQRHLFNKFLGQLHHCLNTGQLYDEHLAFPPPLSIAA